MNKKTFFKFSVTVLFLGTFTALSVKYFPAAALAIKSGIAISAAPVVTFGFFAIIALTSAIALIAFAVSAIRNKSTSSEIDGRSKKENQVEEKRGLVNEKGQAVTVSASPLVPHVTEELTSAVSVEGPETTQPENAVVNGDSAEQQITLKSLTSLPYPSMSPLDTAKQDQPPPAPPSIMINNQDNVVRNDDSSSNEVSCASIPPHDKLKIALPAFERGRKVEQRKRAAMIRSLIPLIHSPSNSTNGEEDYKSLPLPDKEEECGDYHSLPAHDQLMETDDSQIQHIIYARKYGRNFWDSDFDSFSSNVSCNGPNSLLPTEQRLDSIVEERNIGPEERLLDVRLNANGVVHGNSKSVAHVNSRSN